MSKVTNVTLMGSAVVFGVTGRDVLYKVELCEVAAMGDYRMAACFERASGQWRPCELHREHDGAVMAEVESQALLLDSDAVLKWTFLLSEEEEDAARTQPERITELVQVLMTRHRVARKAVATRLGIKDLTLREYCEGTTAGAMGPALVLALEALASRANPFQDE
jgi:hypothetical protein